MLSRPRFLLLSAETEVLPAAISLCAFTIVGILKGLPIGVSLVLSARASKATIQKCSATVPPFASMISGSCSFTDDLLRLGLPRHSIPPSLQILKQTEIRPLRRGQITFDACY
jgi:hypothetical protein